MKQTLQKHWPLLVLIVMTACIYGGIYQAGYVWDDYALVQHNTVTDSWHNWLDLFAMDLWETPEVAQQSGFYRPLFLLSLVLDRDLFGMNPGPQHLHSLIWHLGCVVMVYTLALRLKNQTVALIAAIVFALHPVQHEAVSLIAARNDSMASFFALGTLYLLLDSAPSMRKLAAAGALFSFALFSKESIVLLPLLLLVMDWAQYGRPVGPRRYVLLVCLVAGLFILRASVGIEQPAFPDAAAASKGFEHAIPILGTYAQLLVWPDPLTPARHIDYLDTTAQVMPFLLVCLLGLTALLWRSRNNKWVWAGLIWAGLGLGPSLLITLDPTRGNLGERYLYWPMVGVAIAIAIAIPKRRAAYVALGIWAIASSVLIQQRHSDWQDYNTLWSAAYRDRPSTYTAGGYAWSLANIAQKPDKASAFYLEALEGEPVYKASCDSIVINQMRLGRPEKAAKIWEWASLGRQDPEKRCPISRISIDVYALALLESRQGEKYKRLLSPKVSLPKPSRAPLLAHYAIQRDLDNLTEMLRRDPHAKTEIPGALFLLERLVGDAPSAHWLDALQPSLLR